MAKRPMKSGGKSKKVGGNQHTLFTGRLTLGKSR